MSELSRLRGSEGYAACDDDMAFYIQQVDGGRNPGHEYLPAGAIVPKVGMALTVTGGKLAIASGTTAPSYISMIEKEEALTDGDVIPVMRVLPDMMFQNTTYLQNSTRMSTRRAASQDRT